VPEELKRILAIDHGSKRIGLAVSDPLFFFATPLVTLHNDNKMWDSFTEIIKEKNIIRVILGYPYKDDGTVSSNGEEIMKFKAQFEKRYSLEVILWDERYTSAISKQLIISSVSKKSRRREKGLIDRGSAAIILQEYLDEFSDELKKEFL
jgi:putative holliday junction resolvase